MRKECGIFYGKKQTEMCIRDRDYMESAPVSELEEQLQNCQLELGALESYLKSVHPEQYICCLLYTSRCV